MANMKMSDEERAEQYGGATAMVPAESLYPWGLCITLDDDALEKLKLLKDLPQMDETLELKCKAQVVRVNAYKDPMNGEDESSIALQITDIEIMSRDKDIAKLLYGNSGG